MAVFKRRAQAAVAGRVAAASLVAASLVVASLAVAPSVAQSPIEIEVDAKVTPNKAGTKRHPQGVRGAIVKCCG